MSKTSTNVTTAIQDSIDRFNAGNQDVEQLACALVAISIAVTDPAYRPRRGDAEAVVAFAESALPAAAAALPATSDHVMLSYSLAVHDELKKIYGALVETGQPALTFLPVLP